MNRDPHETRRPPRLFRARRAHFRSWAVGFDGSRDTTAHKKMVLTNERDPALPRITEDSTAGSGWTQEEEDEEQRLYELDNDVGGENAEGTAASAPHPQSNDGEDAVEETSSRQVDPGPIYVHSSAGDRWELTWPIWHLLPRDERRQIVAQYGMKSIGEFEEFMTLSRAMDESELLQVQSPSNSATAVGSAETTPVETMSDVPAGATKEESWHPAFVKQLLEDDDEDESDHEQQEGAVPNESTKTSPAVESESIELDLDKHMEMIEQGGLLLLVPDEILEKCFAFLPVDNFANLALVSPHWKRFSRCNAVYKTLCERVYLIQSKRKALNVAKFGNSYRRMLEIRPRVRTGGGLYVLKYQKVIQIQRDMWTEIPVGAVLESIYYRYLYFFEDGRVLYALTHATPGEMVPRFHRMLLHGWGSKDKWGVWGRFSIKRDTVRVWAKQDWHEVCFQLRVIRSNKELHYGDDRGCWTSMELERHMSSPSGNFDDDSHDLVKYALPDNLYFRFLHDRRL